MIRQSGARTAAEVVDFCRSTGIPLSRMLRLDLLREWQQHQQQQQTSPLYFL
jgi:hypothetical protein